MTKSLIKERFPYKRKSKINLSKLIKLYENNYIKVVNLLPKKSIDSSMTFFLPEGTKNSNVLIKVIKSSKYTSALKIIQSNMSINRLPETRMEVAIYHDLKMAEVIHFNGKRVFWLRNKYPNINMFSKDEKFQWNKFLSEWLTFSKKEGLSNLILNIKALK